MRAGARLNYPTNYTCAVLGIFSRYWKRKNRAIRSRTIWRRARRTWSSRSAPSTKLWEAAGESQVCAGAQPADPWATRVRRRALADERSGIISPWLGLILLDHEHVLPQ